MGIYEAKNGKTVILTQGRLTIEQYTFGIRRRRAQDMIPTDSRDYFEVDYTNDPEFGIKAFERNIAASRRNLAHQYKTRLPGWQNSVRVERDFINAATYALKDLKALVKHNFRVANLERKIAKCESVIEECRDELNAANRWTDQRWQDMRGDDLIVTISMMQDNIDAFKQQLRRLVTC